MKSVVIVGIGALGSHVLLLARNWPAEIKAIDFDSVETKNLTAQFHSKMGLRKNKAIAAQQMMQGVFGWKIEAVPHRLTSDNVKQLLFSADLVIDCTDNIEARLLIQKAGKELKLNVLHGCLSAGGDFARVIWSEHFTPDAEDVIGKATCEDGEQLPFFALAAAHVAQEAQRFLKDGKKRSWQINPTAVQRLA